MHTLRKAFILLAVFLTATNSVLYFESSYRWLVQHLFLYAQGDHIRFVGKNFHLLPNLYIIIGFGVFATLLAALLYGLPRVKVLGYLVLAVALFFLSNLLTTELDSLDKVATCTPCADGIRPIGYNEINYDAHFILGLVAAIVPALTVVIRRKYRAKSLGPTNPSASLTMA